MTRTEYEVLLAQTAVGCLQHLKDHQPARMAAELAKDLLDDLGIRPEGPPDCPEPEVVPDRLLEQLVDSYQGIPQRLSVEVSTESSDYYVTSIGGRRLLRVTGCLPDGHELLIYMAQATNHAAAMAQELLNLRAQ